MLACLWAEDHRKYGTERDAYLYLVINAHWEDHVFELPIIPEGYAWHVTLQSSAEACIGEDGKLWVPPRSVAVLEG